MCLEMGRVVHKDSRIASGGAAPHSAPPGAAFDDQFRQVDAAIRDLQVSNSQILQAGTASNTPYQNFRTTRLDLRQVPVVHYPDGYVYRVVPHYNVLGGCRADYRLSFELCP